MAPAADKPTSPGQRRFEISDADLKTVLSDDLEVAGAGAAAFQLRGQPVMLAADVALVFGARTREIVQNIKSNPDIFPEKYAFQLSEEEVPLLRSAGLIPKLGRGGSRAAPWVVTRKGAIRLATTMRSPQAVRAADIFIDVFDEVAHQLQSGTGDLVVTNPSRIAPTEQDRRMIVSAREEVMAAMKRLFETIVDPQRNTTVADELQAVSAEAVNHIKAWLRGKSIANEKVEAETMLIIEQARDMYERRQADLADKALDRERKTLENLRARIAVAQEMITMYKTLEPSAIVKLADGFAKVARPKSAASRQQVTIGKRHT